MLPQYVTTFSSYTNGHNGWTVSKLALYLGRPPFSALGSETGHTRILLSFTRSFQTNNEVQFKNFPRPLPPISFPIQYSIILLLFDATEPQLLRKSLNKPQRNIIHVKKLSQPYNTLRQRLMPFMVVIFIKFCFYWFPRLKTNRLIQCTLATCTTEDFFIAGLLAVERTTSTAEERPITPPIRRWSVLLSFALKKTLEALLRISTEQESQSTSTRTSGSSKGLLEACGIFKIP